MCLWGMCGQRRPSPACAYAQFEKGLRCPCTEFFGTVEYVKVQNLLTSDPTNICFTTVGAEGEGWDPVKLAKAPHPLLSPVIYYWRSQDGNFIVVLFVKYSVVFHLQMIFF